MAFLVSPGVEIKEIDLTNIIPAVSTSIGAYAGVYEWGPTNEITTLSTEADLISTFGYPVVSTVEGSDSRLDWYAAANFLGYSNNLQLIRILPEGARNAASEPFAARTSSTSVVFTGTVNDSEATIIQGVPVSIDDSDVFTYTIYYNGTTGVTFDIRKPYVVLPDSDYVPGLNKLSIDSDQILGSGTYTYGTYPTDSDSIVQAGGYTYSSLDSDDIATAIDLNTLDSDGADALINAELATRLAANQANDTAINAQIQHNLAAIDSEEGVVTGMIAHNIIANDSDSDARVLLISKLRQRFQSEWDSDQTFNVVYTVADLAQRFAHALEAAGVAGVVVDSDGGLDDAINDPTVTYFTGSNVKPNNYTITDSRNNITIKYFETKELESNVDAATEAVIENENDFLIKESSLAQGSVYAKYPGQRGNGIGVALIDAGIDSEGIELFNGNTVGDIFDTVPATSVWAEENFGTDLLDEVHVVVYTTDTTITGTKNEVLERFAYMSKAKNAVTADGAKNYYVNVINDNSDWIWIVNEERATGTVTGGQRNIGTNVTVEAGTVTPFNAFKTNTSKNGVISYELGGGTDGSAVDSAELRLALDLFKDAEIVDISLTWAGNWAKADKKYLIDICESRKDTVAFISPSYDAAVTNPTSKGIADYFNSSVDGYNSSSYVVFDSGWKRQYDKYNDGYFWIPCAPDIAGLAARTDNENDPWWSPAGLNRGHLRDVVKLSFSPNQAERDELYKQRVNPVVSFRGQGTLLYGDKTGLSRPSAFDRINVRRLFIVLEKAIATAAKFQLFEFNDDITRATFRNMVEPFLNDIKTRRGLTDFLVVCDDTNNTPEVIDSNRFVADIYIKPTRSINFITLNFIAVRTGVSFSEIVNGGAG